MSSIRRRMTVDEVSLLLDKTVVNSLILSATVNDKVTSSTVNSKLTQTAVNAKLTAEAVNSLVSNNIVVGTVWVGGEQNSSVNIGANIAGAAVSFNSNNDIDTSCSCTWSGSSLSVRNSSQNGYQVSYVVVTE